MWNFFLVKSQAMRLAQTGSDNKTLPIWGDLVVLVQFNIMWRPVWYEASQEIWLDRWPWSYTAGRAGKSAIFDYFILKGTMGKKSPSSLQFASSNSCREVTCKKNNKIPGGDRKCDSPVDLGSASVNMLSAAEPCTVLGKSLHALKPQVSGIITNQGRRMF